MSLHNEMAADAEDLLLQADDFATSLYTPAVEDDEDEVDLPVIGDPVLDSDTGKVIESKRQFLVSRADLTSPEQGQPGTFTDAEGVERDCIIDKIMDGGPGAWVIVINLAPGGPA